MLSKLLLLVGMCVLVSMELEAFAIDSADQLSEEQTYDEGTKAMNEARWSDAETAFRRTAEMHGKRADGAIYWQAYVQNKEGHTRQAVQSCKLLASQYAQSKWRGECDALLVEVRGASAAAAGRSEDSRDADNPDDDIKMLALNGLMQQEPEKALPIVKSILESKTQSTRLKEKALFVLTQSQSKEAQNILDQIARGKTDPDLQVKAIHMLAAMKGQDAAAFLNEIYKSSQSERVKDAALNGMFISGDSGDLISLAKAESNAEQKRKIVSKLSLMHSKEVTDYMMELLNK